VAAKLRYSDPERDLLVFEGTTTLKQAKKRSLRLFKNSISQVRELMGTFPQSGTYILKTENLFQLTLPLGSYHIDIRWSPSAQFAESVTWDRDDHSELLHITPIAVSTSEIEASKLQVSMRLSRDPSSIIKMDDLCLLIKDMKLYQERYPVFEPNTTSRTPASV